MNGLIIRPYRAGDTDHLAALFHRAVHEGTTQFYSETERAAWCPAPPEGPTWQARLTEGQTLVAEIEGAPVGFMTLVIETGYLDYAYVAPQVMGKGVASTLYAVLEGRARIAGLTRLETEASHLAERFFARHGWTLLTRQTVERRGVQIPNARMEKTLRPASRIAA